jgi:hypothetical protein
MIQLKIVKTGKGYGKNEKWSRFDDELKTFASIKDAKDWIKETYGRSKRAPMFIDTKDGQSKKIGYVIGFRNADLSHYPVNHWIQQDWIEFREVCTINPD